MVRTLLLLVFSLWLGMGIGVSFVAVPHVFSPGVRDALPPGGSGRIAQGILLRTFQWQAGLAAAACVLELLARSRGSLPATRLRSLLLPTLLGLSLATLFWVHPTMRGHFERKYSADLPEAQRVEAGKQFAAWHGATQAGNLLVLAATLACWWQVAQALAKVSPTAQAPRTDGR